MTLMQIENVGKDYLLGQVRVSALKGVDLVIEMGEFTAIWGPSGSGKTTLLNLIGMIDDPTSGMISFKGRKLNSLSDNDKSDLRNKSVGFVFQGFNLIPVLSALENVMLPAQIQGTPDKRAKKLAVDRLEQVGLADQMKQRPDKLSGGQQQRVSIARALVTTPSVIIADEPTANLDSKNALRIISLMRELNQRENTTFIFSTHDDRLLENVDRLVRLEDGRIIS